MFGAEAVRQIEGGRAVIVGNSQFDILTRAALGAQVGEEPRPDAEGRPAYMQGSPSVLPRSGGRLLPCGRHQSPLSNEAAASSSAREAINAVIEFVE